ncbi:hypothetical protein crov130 [Cafeteria roenbergensis virus]|uniref:Uncharacterized protein n=1 Tax=Cafeteria roenbergensis virus (strain BV-PW1) TaxID=693272 RepID=E3T4Q0_CROVB|nr:hypothetical protein crov130 [Cafeteria roenbergensis virus BV-PW1]ADO67163.1 hypothetical protein crov130 [Cafeteria roenbergensis virus BV-PW1]
MSIMSNIKEIVKKIKQNKPIPKLSQDETFNVILHFENNISNYGYKNKKAVDYFYYLIDYGDLNTVYTYFNQIFETSYFHGLFFSSALAASDIIYYNQEFFSFLIDKKNTHNINYILKESSFKVVIKVLKHLDIFYNIQQQQPFTKYNSDDIIKSCIKNSDDRVYKLMLYMVSSSNITIYLNALTNCSPKYFLKRIKWLNQNIILKNNFNILLPYIIEYTNNLTQTAPYIEWSSVFFKLLKTYQNDDVVLISNKLNLNILIHKGGYNFYYKLKEICTPAILNIINHSILNNISHIKNDTLKIIIEILDCDYTITLNIILKILIDVAITNTDFKKINIINKTLCYKFVNILVNKYKKILYQEINNHDDYSSYIINFLSRYGNYFSMLTANNYYHKINLVKLFLRIKMRQFAKKCKNSLLNKRKRLLNEILTFKPYTNIPVLSQGSRNYQIITQSFHTISHYTLFDPKLFNNTNNMNNISSLIRMNINGTFKNRLPSKIINSIKHLVKSEYIITKTNQELYYLYDVNLTDLTFYERILWLRKYHPLSLPEHYIAFTPQEVLSIINQENTYVEEWININKNKSSIWYPIAYIKYIGNLNELYQMVLNNNLIFNNLTNSHNLIIKLNGNDYKI